MPNWIEGKLKLRGEKEDLLNFIFNGICRDDSTKYEYDYGNYIKLREGDRIYGCDRAGITKDHFILLASIPANKNSVLCIDVKLAWQIHSKELLQIAKEYNLDIKIYGFERGMEFNQDIEIVNNEIVKDETIYFDDYEWDCICPDLGG